MSRKQGKIRKKILVPLVLVLVFMLAASVSGIYLLQKKHIDEDIRAHLHRVRHLFPEFLHKESKFMKAQLEFLKDNKPLQKAWLARDREMLLQQALPIFKDSLARSGVTHFYFIGLDRTCFLRVHNPARNSDYIDRFTMDEAVRSTAMAYGIELGPLGTFTLRVVSPWIINGRLAGYIELGEEIEHLAPSLKKVLGVDLTFAINKENLNRTIWEEGLKMLGRSGDWGKYPQYVIANTALGKIPALIHEYLSLSAPENFSFEYSVNDKAYQGGSIPLFDAGHRNVGKLIVLFEVTENVAPLYSLLKTLIVFSIIIGGALFVFFFHVTGSIERNIVETFNDLDTEIKERQRAEDELKKHQGQLELLVYERTQELETTNTILQKEVQERIKMVESLKESEERFRAISVTAADAIVLLDNEGKITYWNPAAEKMFDYPREEAIGKELHLLFAPREKHELYKKGFSRFRVTGNGPAVGKTLEFSAVRRDGSEFPIEVSTSAIQVKGKWHAAGIIRDISKRKKAEEKLIRQRAELQEINADLSTLYRVSSALSMTIDLDKLLEIILNTITGLDFIAFEKKGGIFLIEDDRMVLASHLGHSETFLDLHKGMRVGDCLCGLAAKTGEIIISGNCDEDSRHTFRPPGMLSHGHIIIPFRARDIVTGVLYLYIKPGITMDNAKLTLFSSIANQLGIAIENARLYKETKMYSLQDPLTGLANRRLLNVELKMHFAGAKRFKKPFSVIMLDIDYFKHYNDTYGHSAGDKSLTGLAGIILKEIREIDLAVRYGGEEFLVLLPETDLSEASEVAERLRKHVEESMGITISLGIASYNEGIGEDELIQKADEALYQAKQKGRNRIEVTYL